MTAGGGKAKTMALRIVANAPIARPATALAFKSRAAAEAPSPSI